MLLYEKGNSRGYILPLLYVTCLSETYKHPNRSLFGNARFLEITTQFFVPWTLPRLFMGPIDLRHLVVCLQPSMDTSYQDSFMLKKSVALLSILLKGELGIYILTLTCLTTHHNKTMKLTNKFA